MDQHDSLIFLGISDEREAHSLSAALFYMNQVFMRKIGDSIGDGKEPP